MREWFEPGAFQYFSLLQSKKEANPKTFKYERVMVFKSAADRSNAEENILDGYYAKALALSHQKLNIPIGWLRPKEFREVLKAVPKRHQHLFRKHLPQRLSWLPFWIQKLDPAQLDYAVIDRPAGRAVIIVPFKKEEALVLGRPAADPYLEVADKIKAIVHNDQGSLLLNHDLLRHLRLV